MKTIRYNLFVTCLHEVPRRHLVELVEVTHEFNIWHPHCWNFRWPLFFGLGHFVEVLLLDLLWLLLFFFNFAFDSCIFAMLGQPLSVDLPLSTTKRLVVLEYSGIYQSTFERPFHQAVAPSSSIFAFHDGSVFFDSICSMTMPAAIFPVTFVGVSVWIRVDSFAVTPALEPYSLIDRSVWIMHNSETVSFVIQIFAFVHATLLPGIFAFTIPHSVEVHSFINIAIFKHHLTEARSLPCVIALSFVCANVESILFLVEVCHAFVCFFGI
ncbi:hypothetical protein TRFO_30637 [Tritrichomonas foetus]|uniref:Uncharacterized protein n=1 Tax=Tritrichomonas foetus TaxID=1144522 RepID=A0A1J4JT25_9EUKA|nr:hypothetical protein TRFO_30637 [Tritrichomonas foetus]|eukprot:OHT02273.1 hypothetical protein TRFO_30637 [Tritrichomonas foetus]